MTLELAPCKPSKKKDSGDGMIEQIEKVGAGWGVVVRMWLGRWGLAD